MEKSQIQALNKQFINKSTEEVLTYFLQNYPNKIALASSLSIEDQVLTDMLVKISPSVRIFTLDTGRLFPETYSLIERTNMNYGIKIQVMFPDYSKVEDMVARNGINLFYESVEKRRLCCAIRKIEPLQRALKGLKIWICGLRKEQSQTRQEDNLIEWDNANSMIKLNPLIDWTESQVWEYIRKHQVPYNLLHDKGFPSIGCQPCTRAVKTGEDIRGGRWWWESPEHKECGLHNSH